MELKRVLARDSRTATAKAIELYGKEALIISNERVNGKVEVIVAVDVTASDREQFDGPDLADTADESSRAVQKPAALHEVPAGPARFGALLHENMEQVRKSVQVPDDAGLRASDSFDRRELDRAKDLVEMVRGELAEMRREFRIAQQVGQWQTNSGVREEVKPLADALFEAGVPVSLRSLLLDEVRERDSLTAALGAIETLLRHTVKRERKAEPLSGVQVIAGPSGAGKSMMVGRLAVAHASTNGCQPEDVAIVSFRDQRPGAWNQIQLLSAQAGVDCYRASSESMLREVLAELSGRRLVLVDTAGGQEFDHLAAIMKIAPDAGMHLVLPAEASAATFKRFLDQPGLNWKSLMLSKLDEASHPWPLVQALCEKAIPISFASRAPGLDSLVEGGDTDALVSMVLDGIRSHLTVEALPGAGIGKDFSPNVWRANNRAVK